MANSSNLGGIPQGWRETLERARADVAAGRTHDVHDLMQALEIEDAALPDKVQVPDHGTEAAE